MVTRTDADTETTLLAQSHGGDGCFVGTLEHMPLGELLADVHRHRRTGMLRIGDGLEAAVIFFAHGDIYRCEWGRLQGEVALSAICKSAHGRYSLILRNAPQPRPNITTTTSHLLARLAAAGLAEAS